MLDAVREDCQRSKPALGRQDQARLEEHLASVRDLERADRQPAARICESRQSRADGGDLKDWPRIAKMQRDLLVHALASGQTRVASYMLTKCQGLSRFPWLGYTDAAPSRLHPHGKRRNHPQAQRIMRDICRWHVEEFAYLLAQAEVDSRRRRQRCSITPACCISTSTPRRTITRTTAWRRSSPGTPASCW